MDLLQKRIKTFIRILDKHCVIWAIGENRIYALSEFYNRENEWVEITDWEIDQLFFWLGY